MFCEYRNVNGKNPKMFKCNLQVNENWQFSSEM